MINHYAFVPVSLMHLVLLNSVKRVTLAYIRTRRVATGNTGDDKCPTKASKNQSKNS